jgi:hypothetical protein
MPTGLEFLGVLGGHLCDFEEANRTFVINEGATLITSLLDYTGL